MINIPRESLCYSVLIKHMVHCRSTEGTLTTESMDASFQLSFNWTQFKSLRWVVKTAERAAERPNHLPWKAPCCSDVVDPFTPSCDSHPKVQKKKAIRPAFIKRYSREFGLVWLINAGGVCVPREDKEVIHAWRSYILGGKLKSDYLCICFPH